MKETAALDLDHLTAEHVCQLLGIAERTLRDLQRRFGLPRSGPGNKPEYRWRRVWQWYVGYHVAKGWNESQRMPLTRDLILTAVRLAEMHPELPVRDLLAISPRPVDRIRVSTA